MERLSLIISENAKRLSTVSLQSAGIFIKLYLQACAKTGDDIELGTVESFGRELSEQELMLMCSCDAKTLKASMRELKNAELIGLNPLRILHFYDDNFPFIKRRRSNIDRKRESEPSPYGTRTGVGTKSEHRIDKSRVDKKRKEELPIEVAPPSDNPEDVFRFYYHALRGHEFAWLARLVKEYGSPKFNAAIKLCGEKGYAKGRVEEWLKGDGKFKWEKDDKPVRRNRHRVDKD